MRRKFCILSLTLFFCFVQSAFSLPGIVCAYEPNRNDGKTSSGVPFNPFSATCAHASLPFGTSVAFTCGDRAAANVIVTDRINASDDVFFVAKGVMDRLAKNGDGAIKVNYVVAKTGDGTTAWGDKGNPWYVAGNVRSSDIFMLYEQLLKLGYKPRISSDSTCLEIPYVVEHRWSMLMSDLGSLGADVSAIVKTEMEMNPMRL